jgi:CDP-2,3-bis-(O-geranylgeranyl)-sn-glycerol synthase
MALEDIAIGAFIYILPAYIANSSAALFGGGKPLDFGKRLRDGKRLLGDGKTFRGTFAGIFFGTLTGYLMGLIANDQTYFYLTLGLLLSIGAILGDIIAAFLKRRAGIERGKPVPLLDQWDFVIVAVIFGSFVAAPKIEELTFLLIVTPAIHFFFNLSGYLLKLKNVPW